MHIKRVIPIFFIIIALLYIIFSFTVEERKMIGDVRGWDPGSRAIPIGIGLIMLATSIYLSRKEKSPPGQDRKPHDPGIRKLTILTILLCIFFILFFRFLGFIISTHIFLFSLIFLYYKRDIRWSLIPEFSIGLLICTGVMIAFYSIGRFISRYLFLLGRKSEILVLKSKLATAGVPLVILLILFTVLLIILKNPIKRGKYRVPLIAGFSAIGITEFLFIVFRQIFLVSLVKGFVFW